MKVSTIYLATTLLLNRCAHQLHINVSRCAVLLLAALPGTLLAVSAEAAPPGGWQSSECVKVGQPCTPTSRKFFPGFYALYGSNNGTPVNISSIAGKDQYVGVVRSYYWNVLETGFGVYDFSRIEDDKAVAAASGRKLGINVRLGRITPASTPVTPQYTWNDSSYGGVVTGAYGNYLGASTNDIYKPMTWNTKVKSRVNALLDALAKRYNKDPDIAFILIFEETTGGASTADDPGYACSSEIQALKDIFTHAYSVFPNTPILMELDFACTDIPTSLHQFVINGGHGAWTIDARPCSTELDKNAYSLYRNRYNEIAGAVLMEGWTDIGKGPCFLTASQIIAELGPGKTFQPRYFLVDHSNSVNQASINQAVDDWWTQHGKVWPFNQPPVGWK